MIFAPPTYLADTSSLINLVNDARSPKVRLNYLTRLLTQNRLKVPEIVAKEIGEGDDRLKGWAQRHMTKCISATGRNIADLQQISRDYARFLLRPDKKGAADPVIICMARHYRERGWTVLSDDGGVQAVCAIERLTLCTSKAFRMLENV